MCCRISFALALLLSAGLSAAAQKPAANFRPGEWEIDSVTTVMNGRAISSQTTLCAGEQADFWKVPQAGMVCKDPVVKPLGNGKFRVTLVCHYASGQLTSSIRSQVVETVAPDGDSFQAAGTTTTNTVYQGVRPTRTSAQLNATAHRTGPCH